LFAVSKEHLTVTGNSAIMKETGISRSKKAKIGLDLTEFLTQEFGSTFLLSVIIGNSCFLL